MTSQQARESKESRLAEPQLRAAADGLALTVRVDAVGLGVTRHRRFFVVDQTGRALRISPQLVLDISASRLRAVLAAFAEGATAIKWLDGTTLVLPTEPEAQQATEGELG